MFDLTRSSAGDLLINNSQREQQEKDHKDVWLR